MKLVLLSAAIINSILGTYNMFSASMSWGVFNFFAAAACIFSYLQSED